MARAKNKYNEVEIWNTKAPLCLCSSVNISWGKSSIAGGVQLMLMTFPPESSITRIYINYIILWFTVLIFNVNINYNMIIYINSYVDLNYIEWTQLFDQLWDLNPGPRKLAGLVWNVCTVQHYKYVCIIVQMCTICRTSCVWQNRAWAHSWNYQTNQS